MTAPTRVARRGGRTDVRPAPGADRETVAVPAQDEPAA